MQGWHELHSNSITEKFYPLLKNPWTYLCHSGNLQNWDEFECQWLVIQFHDDSCLLIRKLQSILQSHSLPELICCNFKFSNVVSPESPSHVFRNAIFKNFYNLLPMMINRNLFSKKIHMCTKILEFRGYSPLNVIFLVQFNFMQGKIKGKKK